MTKHKLTNLEKQERVKIKKAKRLKAEQLKQRQRSERHASKIVRVKNKVERDYTAKQARKDAEKLRKYKRSPEGQAEDLKAKLELAEKNLT